MKNKDYQDNSNGRDHCCPHQDSRRLADDVEEFYSNAIPEPDDFIGRFTCFKANQWGISVAEAGNRSITRLFERFQEAAKPVVILTAFRSELSLPQNRRLNVLLAADIRELGWGYARVQGKFLESTKDDNGQEQPVRTSEESIVGISGLGPKKVMPALIKLMERYRQEAALIMLPKMQEALVLSSYGGTLTLGAWPASLDQMATYYARMRSGPKDRMFRFEAAGDDSVMTRWAVATFFKNK